jgi:hypothetical protein
MFLTSSSESMSTLLVSSRASIRVRFNDNTNGDRHGRLGGWVGLILRLGGRGMRRAPIHFEIVLPLVADAPGLHFGGIFTEWMHADELAVYFSAIGN